MRALVAAAVYGYILLVAVPPLAQAQGTAPPAAAGPPPWYTQVAGIIAVPAALIGIVYSYALAKKTRLEVRKTELEILEKERALTLNPIPSEVALQVQQTLAPLVAGKRMQLIVTRFVVLYLLQEAWGFAREGYQLILKLVVGLLSLFVHIDSSDGPMQVLVVGPFLILQRLPEVVSWIIFFSVGWPLFREANDFAGINLRTMFRVRSKKVAPAAPAVQHDPTA